MSDQGLFGAPVTVTAGASDGLKEAWKEWCKATSRPRQLTPDKVFATAYKKAVADNVSHDRIMDVVHAASFLPPRPRDPRDTRRFSMALSKPAWVSQGKALAESGAEPVAFQSGEKAKMLPSDLAELCGTDWSTWPSSEMESAAVLCALEPDEVKKGVRVTKERMGSAEVLPSDVLRKRAVWNKDYVAPVKVATRTVHERAATERAELSGLLDLDVAATKMYLKGAKLQDVMAFHNLAPDGFWQDVKATVSSGVSLGDAVSLMESKYNWDSRRV